MQASFQLESCGPFSTAHPDVVFTPGHVAAAIVRHFSPTGRVLDPCKGDGAFLREMPGASHCELQEGSDFFNWTEPVDWIVSNPPYSIYRNWLLHSFKVAENIVYLIPISKAFTTSVLLAATHEYGGIVEIAHIGSGRSIGFDLGLAVGAVHYKRGYRGGIHYTHACSV
jgi:hypothetical protein